MTESPYDLTSMQKRRFGQTLVALPGQYLKVLTRPAIKTVVKGKLGHCLVPDASLGHDQRAD